MRSALCAILFLAVLSLPLRAQPAGAAQGAGQGPAAGAATKNQTEAVPEAAGANKAAKKTTSRPAKVATSPGSGETRAERTARLRRECKGMPNAGACTGMTH